MTDEPPKKRRPDPPDYADANERPTINPPFDVEAFARVASAPSEQPRAPSDAPTNRPPRPPGPAEFEPEARTARITLTNEVELERARALSAAQPPRTVTSSALSMANARAPSSPIVAPVAGRAEEGGPTPDPTPSSIEAAVLDAIGESAAPEITERTIEDPVAEMRERFSLGDYTGALEMSELILAGEPSHPDASECGENCRTVLENMYAARLGPLDRVPMVMVPRAQMRWLSMDHRAGFVLSLIDGSSSVEMILDVSGMPKLDALRILYDLVQQKIVSFR
ncbi:MAG TPA: hypothetical protein VN894_16300 [Polyangiaceae bacterium]|nr:hypothetical protein [Polyangiaceae bacterium]